jgi:hypothetical protein
MVRVPVHEVPEMPKYRAELEPYAWWLTREQIGQKLRERYQSSKELPPKLLSLVSKFDAIDGKHLLRRAPRRELAAVHSATYNLQLNLNGGRHG